MHATQQSKDDHLANCNTKKNELWALEPHICRKCFARLVSQPVPGGDLRRFACSNCGAEAEGRKADALCCCGIKIRKGGGGKGGSLVDAGVRCIQNPKPSLEFPSLYVASEVKR